MDCDTSCPRQTADGKRELVIGRATRGYGMLYRFLATIDTVFVPALRAHREDGFTLAP